MASDKPGQVVDMGTGREIETRASQPSLYDVTYRKGEVIDCADPNVICVLRSGVVSLNINEGKTLVAVDAIQEAGIPLQLSLVFKKIPNDQTPTYIALTEVTVMELPLEHLQRGMSGEGRFQFMWSLSKAVAENIARLRLEHLKALRSNAFLQQENQRIAQDNIRLQIEMANKEGSGDELDQAFAESSEAEKHRLEAENKRLMATIESLRLDLKASKSREVEARKASLGAYEAFEDLKQEQEKQSVQVPLLINHVLRRMAEEGMQPQPLGIPKLMYLLAMTPVETRSASEDDPLADWEPEGPSETHTPTIIPPAPQLLADDDPDVIELAPSVPPPPLPPPLPVACPSPRITARGKLETLMVIDDLVTDSRSRITSTLQGIPAGLPPRPSSLAANPPIARTDDDVPEPPTTVHRALLTASRVTPPPLPIVVPNTRRDLGLEDLPYHGEEATTAKGVVCPPSIPLAALADGEKQSTAAIDVRAFRKPVKKQP